VRLKTTRAGGQPIVFRKMVSGADPGTGNGEAVRIVDDHGRVLGRGFYNRQSELALRILERTDGPDLDGAWVLARLRRCVELRRRTLDLESVTDAWRVINAEGDGLSGVIVDTYNDVIVIDVRSLGWYRRIVELKDALRALFRPRVVVVRADPEVERIEKFRVLGGSPGETATDIKEHGVRYRVDGAAGHKTGFFLDQRDQRRRMAERSRGRRVLDLCCYTGGFSLNAVRGSAARVQGVDLDEAAIAIAKENAVRNGSPAVLQFVHGDAFDVLRETNPGTFDFIVSDPPKFAATRASLPEAMKRYEDLNTLVFEKVAKAGLVLTCSCSGLVSEEEFLAMLARAATRAGRETRILEIAGAAPDHPFAMSHPEGRYLKCVWLAVD
jgi:23S rRNA (cytosine1962-C5)-methyltransferase